MVRLDEKAWRAVEPGRVIAFGHLLPDDSGRGAKLDGTQPSRHDQLALPIIGAEPFGDDARPAERRAGAVGILAVVTARPLANTHQIDRPVAAQIDPKRRAPTGDVGTVDIIAIDEGTVDIPALRFGIENDAKRGTIARHRQVRHQADIAARRAMLGQAAADLPCPRRRGKVGRMGHEADDPADRSGTV